MRWPMAVTSSKLEAPWLAARVQKVWRVAQDCFSLHRHCTARSQFKLELDIRSSSFLPKYNRKRWLGKWGKQDLNLRPAGYESVDLPLKSVKEST